MTYFNRKQKLMNKVRKINAVSGNDAEMADKIVHESVYNITFWSTSRIELIKSKFKLIKFHDSRKNQVENLVEDKNAIVDVANTK